MYTFEREREIKIVVVPGEQINEVQDMYRVSCEGMNSGWGETLLAAIKNFDEINAIYY